MSMKLLGGIVLGISNDRLYFTTDPDPDLDSEYFSALFQHWKICVLDIRIS